MVTPAPRRSLPLVYEVEAEPTQAEIVYLPVVAAPSFYRRRGKRLLDLALSIPLCLIAAPIVAVLAIMVVVTSGWPAFYGAKRVGLGGRPFRMWKLRSMVKDADCLPERWSESNPDLAAEYSQNFKLKDDPRVTSLGRFLRRTSLDELPQLLSVVRGEMSLVGPRPYFARELADAPRAAAVISQLRPGLTGPWQVSGRNDLLPEVRMALDIRYAETVSLTSDLGYLARTITTLLKANGI